MAESEGVPLVEREQVPHAVPRQVNEGTRLVLVGKTGSGKSTLGNLLLQKEDIYREDLQQLTERGESNIAFVVADSFESETAKCDYGMSNNAWGRQMKVLDTPGLFDTSQDPGRALRELSDVMSITSPGPHAVLFLTRCDVRFTEEESNAFWKIIEVFKEDVKKFLILVFTHGEVIKRGTIKQKLEAAPDSLKKVMEVVGNNYVVVSQTENEKKRESEVRNLLEKVDLLSESGASFYVNDSMKEMTAALVKEIEKVMKERDISWSEAEFLVKKGLAMEKEQRWKDLKKKLLVIAVASPLFAALIGLTGGLAAVGIAGATVVEAVVGGSLAGGAAFVGAKLTELATYLREKKKATGKCVIS